MEKKIFSPSNSQNGEEETCTTILSPFTDGKNAAAQRLVSTQG
jgi:hypothetical protein